MVTASKWSNALDALVLAARTKHGTVTDNGQTVPIVTNQEAVQLVRAWHIASPSDFALWYQYAALAYGWDPPDSDMLDASAERGNRGYRLLVALWAELARVAMVLDNEGVEDPRLDMAVNYSDPVWLGEVRAALLADGASATFKLPTGLCKDKKTGKRRPMRTPFPGAKCAPNKDGEGRYRDPFTGAELPCDLPGDCDPYLIDDPITGIVKRLGPVLSWALVLGALWLIAKDNPQPRRQRRN